MYHACMFEIADAALQHLAQSYAPNADVALRERYLARWYVKLYECCLAHPWERSPRSTLEDAVFKNMP